MEEVTPGVGDTVVYHDPVGMPHTALVTAVWGPTCINLVHVSSDVNRTDDYGRQIERQSSCQHGSVMKVHGNYWRWSIEEPNGYTAPLSV